MILSVIHHPPCGCEDPRPYVTPSAHLVAVYLWGRDRRTHTVYAGECPYHFVNSAVDVIEAVLDAFPLAMIRDKLPYRVYGRALPATLAMRHRVQPDWLVCVIGGNAEADTGAEQSSGKEA